MSQDTKGKSKKVRAKQFKCDICDYKSKYKHLIKEHLYVHTGEKPYLGLNFVLLEYFHTILAFPKCNTNGRNVTNVMPSLAKGQVCDVMDELILEKSLSNANTVLLHLPTHTVAVIMKQNGKRMENSVKQ